MRKIPVAVMILVFPGLLQAQSVRDINKGDTILNKNAPATVLRVIPISEMDQRMIYRWDNGQSSTPTGRQAGDAFAKYAMVFGDSAAVVYGWTEKTKTTSNPSAKH